MEVLFKVFDSFSPELLEKIKRIELDNLGKDAAINEWQIPVLIRYGRVIAAQDRSGEILGLCEMIRKWDEKKVAFIHSLYVLVQYRNKSVGKKLLDHVIGFLGIEGFLSAELTVDPENDIALKMYEKAGFEKAGYRKDEYGRNIDRLLMRIKIKQGTDE